MPVATSGGLEVVVATVPTDELRAGVLGAWVTIVGLGIALVGLSVAVAFRLGRRTSEPVLEVAEVAHRLREGDSTARAVPGGPPETAELGRALNALADRIHGLVVAEREHVADLGHRLRTPVTALRLDTDLVEDDELAHRLRGHVDELQRSIDDVVREARRTVSEELPGTAGVDAQVAERVSFWQPLAEDQGRRLELVVDRTPVTDPRSGSVTTVACPWRRRARTSATCSTSCSTTSSVTPPRTRGPGWWCARHWSRMPAPGHAPWWSSPSRMPGPACPGPTSVAATVPRGRAASGSRSCTGSRTRPGARCGWVGPSSAGCPSR